MNKKKLLAITGIFLLLANMILFAFGKISSVLFWLIIVPVAVFAFLILPKIE